MNWTPLVILMLFLALVIVCFRAWRRHAADKREIQAQYAKVMRDYDRRRAPPMQPFSVHERATPHASHFDWRNS